LTESVRQSKILPFKSNNVFLRGAQTHETKNSRYINFAIALTNTLIFV